MRPKRLHMAKDAYDIRKKYGYSWGVIARRTRTKEHNVRKAAEEYALLHQLEWPLEFYSRGKMIYEMLAGGMSLLAIRNEIGMETCMSRKYARDYARRRGKLWPISRCYGCRCVPCDCRTGH